MFKSLYFWLMTLAIPLVVVSPLIAHESKAFKADRQLPYDGPGFRADDGGQAPIIFGQNSVTLQSWIPLVDFGASMVSGDDCWGYASPSGREYAFIGLSHGTGVVEVTNPGNAQILTVQPGPASSWRDIKIFQNYAYVVSEGGDGIQVYDLSQIDAGTVTLVNTVTNGGTTATHNVAINQESGFLYRVGGGSSPILGIRVYDLNADPTSPNFVGEWNGRYCHDVQVVTWKEPPFVGSEIVFCFANNQPGGGQPGIDILDVTNKADITLIGTIDLSLAGTLPHPAKFAHQGWLSTDRKYVYFGDEVDEQVSGTTTTTRVIDVSDLTNPFQTSWFTNGSIARDHNVYTVGNIIFEANYRSGLRIYDATNPTAPVEIAYFDTYPENDSPKYNGLWNVYPYFPSGTVIGSDLEKGLFVWTTNLRLGPPIPTVSTWGLLIMCLVLLAIATLMIKRHQKTSQQA